MLMGVTTVFLPSQTSDIDSTMQKSESTPLSPSASYEHEVSFSLRVFGLGVKFSFSDWFFFKSLGGSSNVRPRQPIANQSELRLADLITGNQLT